MNALVRSCTALDTAKRFQSVSEVIEACAAVAEEASAAVDEDAWRYR